MSSIEELTALVDLRLHAATDRAYRLPGSGSRSLLFVFDRKQIGAMASTADGRDLAPGTKHDAALLTFWEDEVRILVTEGSPFSIWYGGVVGNGTVRSVGWKNAR